jgi:hypothetical protein
MEEIDLTKPFTSTEIVETFDKGKNYEIVLPNGNQFKYCKVTDVSPTSKISFLCSRTLSKMDTRSTSAHVTPITLTLKKMDYNDEKKDHEYKVNDPENYKIYVSDAMGGRRRKSRKSKKSRRSKKSRKSRK